MKPAAKTYAIIISVVGLLLGLYCSYQYGMSIIGSADLSREIVHLIMLLLLAYLCRCLPIYIRADFAIDMAFISNLAILLCKGPFAAAAITFILSPFVVVPGPGPERKLTHIFNTPFIKTSFNTAILTISVFVGGLAFVYSGGIVGNLSFPGVLLPMICLILTIIAVNSVLLIMLFKLNIGMPFFRSVLKNLIEFMPSVIAAAPIGYFIAHFMLQVGGEYTVIFFILPLLLARFAFSMYVDVKRNYYVMLKTLTNTIEAKDKYTRGHSERVEVYAKTIAREMHRSEARVDDISVAALLHDVGKIGIDENILKKPARLTEDERKVIQAHPVISVSILKDVNLSAAVFNMILHHHERYDGKGYPDGLGGDLLPIDVYILGVADTYDAITSDRPYSLGRTAQEARDIILSERGKQFHPDVVDAFEKAYNKGKMNVIYRVAIGTADEREAEVVGV